MADRSSAEVIILGAGGTGRDVREIFEHPAIVAEGYQCLGFLDDDPGKRGTRVAGLPVLGSLAQAGDWPCARFVNALGSPQSYRRRPATLASTGLDATRFISLVHPSASVSARCEMGRGVILYPNVVVGPDAYLGDFVTVLSNSVINHDAMLGAWTIVASGVSISGAVRVGTCCYLGAGATIKESSRIGDGALVGMGAVVLNDVPPGATAVGNPARILRANDDPGAPEHE